MKNIGAVVVTFNNARTIKQCLSSLISSGLTSIVVVDNASSDQTLAAIGEMLVIIAGNEENVGFATAANKGARLLSARSSQVPDYVLFINPDAALEAENGISEAVKYLDNHPRVGVAGLMLCAASGQAEPNGFGQEVTLASLVGRKLNQVVPTSPTAVGWVSGGAMLVRRTLFEQLEGFDSGYFMYWEDVDLCRRARQAGAQVVILPSVKVRHERGASLLDHRRRTALYDQSADRYFRRHYATPIWLMQKFLRLIYRWSGRQAY